MDFEEDEPIPPLPWVDVARRIRNLKAASTSTASFIHSVQVVLDEMGYEVKRARVRTKVKPPR